MNPKIVWSAQLQVDEYKFNITFKASPAAACFASFFVAPVPTPLTTPETSRKYYS